MQLFWVSSVLPSVSSLHPVRLTLLESVAPFLTLLCAVWGRFGRFDFRIVSCFSHGTRCYERIIVCVRVCCIIIYATMMENYGIHIVIVCCESFHFCCCSDFVAIVHNINRADIDTPNVVGVQCSGHGFSDIFTAKQNQSSRFKLIYVTDAMEKFCLKATAPEQQKNGSFKISSSSGRRVCFLWFFFSLSSLFGWCSVL